MNAWNYLQLTLGLMLMFALGFKSGVAACRAFGPRHEPDEDDDDDPPSPHRGPPGEPHVNIRVTRGPRLFTPH